MKRTLLNILKWIVYYGCLCIVADAWNKEFETPLLVVLVSLELLEDIEEYRFKKNVERLMESKLGARCRLDDKLTFYSVLTSILAITILLVASIWSLIATRKVQCIVGLVYCLILEIVTKAGNKYNTEQLVILKNTLPTIKEDLKKVESSAASEDSVEHEASTEKTVFDACYFNLEGKRNDPLLEVCKPEGSK